MDMATLTALHPAPPTTPTPAACRLSPVAHHSLVEVGACVPDVLCAACEAEGHKVDLVGLAKLLECHLVLLCEDGCCVLHVANVHSQLDALQPAAVVHLAHRTHVAIKLLHSQVGTGGLTACWGVWWWGKKHRG